MKRYKEIAVWLSWVILALAFVLASDDSWRPVGVPAVFGLGALLYGLGMIREGKRGRRPSFLVQLLLTMLMCVAMILSLLGLGGRP